MPNHRTYITEGSSVGSIDSRPSELADSIGSVSKVARAKNWRMAACRKLSYSAPTTSAGGRFMFGTAGIIDHACAVRRCSISSTTSHAFAACSSSTTTASVAGSTRTPTWRAPPAPWPRGSHAAGVSEGRHRRLLVGKPPGVDCRALGLPAPGRHRRSHRLPCVGRLPAARRRDRQVAAGADWRGSRGVLARRLGRRRCGAWTSWTGTPRAPSSARRSRAMTPPRSSSRRARPPSPRASSSRTATCWPTSCPVEREILKYRRYAWPFSPIRFLNLLPLSHMFGQSMATFIPPMLAGTVLFIHGYNPHDIVRHIKARRISVLVSVPKILDVLREHVLRVAPVAAEMPPPASTSCGGGGDTAPFIARSAGSSGASSSARRRSIPRSRSSGDASATS